MASAIRARRPSALLALTTALVAACGPNGPDPTEAGGRTGPTEALAEIEALHRQDERAAVSGDTAALASLWTREIVALPPGQEPVRGAEAMLEDLRARLSEGAEWETLEYALDFEEVLVRGELAVEWGSYRGRSRHRETGDTVVGGGHLMRILRRTPDGDWRVHRTIWND